MSDYIERRSPGPRLNVWDTLPVELYSHIFMIAARDERLEDVLPDLLNDPWDPPIAMVISSVCCQWRRVALETPLMWQFIDMCVCASSPVYLTLTLGYVVKIRRNLIGQSFVSNAARDVL